MNNVDKAMELADKYSVRCDMTEFEVKNRGNKIFVTDGKVTWNAGTKKYAEWLCGLLNSKSPRSHQPI